VTPSEVRAFLARHQLAAHRDRGQNFLVDDRLAAKLVGLAGVEAGDTVLEIGTGLGLLSQALAARASRVVSVEIDAGLVRALRAERTLPANVELVHADALAVDLRGLVADAAGPVRVVANLPYAVASPLLRRLLDLRDVLADWSVMLQREVAERVAARPGTRAYGSLAVLHAWTVSVQRALDLHPRCFHPVPRVTSRFLRLTPLPVREEPVREEAVREEGQGEPGALRPGELERLEPWLRAAFAHRRKTIRGALRASAPRVPGAAGAGPALAELGVPDRARPAELSPLEWLQLARRLAD